MSDLHLAKHLSLKQALAIQLNTLTCLITRDMRRQFSGSALGYLWALIQPILWVLSFYLIFHYAGRAVPMGMDLGSFIVSGIVTFQAFQKTYDAVKKSLGADKVLLYFPQVRPIDLMLSKGILGSITYLVILGILIFFNHLLFQTTPLHSVLMVTLGVLMSGFLGFVFGMFVGAASIQYSSLDRIVPILMRPLFFISGIFFLPSQLPLNVLNILKYNPIMQCIDLVRAGLFGFYNPLVFSASYMFYLSLVLLFLGLLSLNVFVKRLNFS